MNVVSQIPVGIGKRYKRYLSVVTKPKLGFPQHPQDSGNTLLDNSHEANVPR